LLLRLWRLVLFALRVLCLLLLALELRVLWRRVLSRRRVWELCFVRVEGRVSWLQAHGQRVWRGWAFWLGVWLTFWWFVLVEQVTL
jgi:hypothetical protein